MSLVSMTNPTAQPKHHKVIILGSGPAGLTAAIYTARANLAPAIIHGPLAGGQLTTTTDVENFPGFPEGIMGPELMSLMEKQAVKFGAQVTVDTIMTADLSKRPFSLKGQSGAYTCDTLIISTGAAPKYIGAQNERELLGYGVSTCATCDGAFFRNKVMAVVGGGDSACEEASFLTRFASKVYLIHRRDQLRASKIMQERVLSNPKIEMVWNKHVLSVQGNKQDGVTGLVLEDTRTKEQSTLATDALFVAIGHTPNSKIFEGQLEMDENGYLLHKPNSSETDVAGVYVCGDVQDHVFRQAITAAGSGCMAAIEAERWLEAQHK
jgi:thioredoxin reductase (NADPH)